MVAYEASTRVPVVIAGPGINHVGDGNVRTLTSLIDLMPTFLEFAGAPTPRFTSDVGVGDPTALDGTSLVPLLQHGDAAAASHPDHIVSQFHGENLAMSWYMVRRGEMKYVAWGTGEQHEPQLFNVTSDPDEWVNLAAGLGILHGPAKASAREVAAHPYGGLASELDALLRTDIDYPAVTLDVATYNIQMTRWWMGIESNWRGVLEGGNSSHPKMSRQAKPLNADWGELWLEHPDKYFTAWWRWLNSSSTAGTPAIPKCPSTLEHGWD